MVPTIRPGAQAREEPDDEDPEIPEVDLHDLRPEDALRKARRELHAARVRRLPAVLLITGAGHGNPKREPVLRRMVEAWLAGPEGRLLGVVGHEVRSRGGALLVRLARQPGR